MATHSRNSDSHWLNSIILAIACLSTFTYSQEQCAQRSCYPATGDLLIGREDQLYASSTCGLKGREKYCIVGFLKQPKKCFVCDSRKKADSAKNGYEESHRLKYIISDKVGDKLTTWWQAKSGKENVFIQLDLEAEFHFTHIIMTFKTFRPAGMIVEKSADYGRTWSVYRYFASNCAKLFPDVKRGPQKRIDDVICEEKYSGIEPSTEGEVVMKVLDPLIPVKNPYSYDVQKLLKLTNLRINFTKLHTLGDDALSDGPDVRNKYYYALYEMVVRGSCSCYGHAEQCIPVNGSKNSANMVHGQCNCTHNTRGRNCELCKEGYNDLPWRPALKTLTNECKKCNCHDHSNKCHFDPAVYKATGNVSGGVCDDCKHNTTGRQCEQCKPLFYRDPFKDLTDPKVCLPCDCDPSGSTGFGECETYTDPIDGTVAGRCLCKRNVQGRRCDLCKDGFWNLQESNLNGCQSCNCDPRGTVTVNKCNSQTGRCNCKRFVRGTTCNQCYPRYWGLGTSSEGCQPCNCDIGGAYNDNCDDITGSCECRPNIIGRQCDAVRPGYYAADTDQIRFEAEEAVPSLGTVFTEIKQIPPSDNKDKTWTGDGYVRVKDGSIFEFTMVRVPNSGNYDVVIRYKVEGLATWSNLKATIRRNDGRPLSGGPCLTTSSEKSMVATLQNYEDSAKFSDSVCLQSDVVYKVEVEMPKPPVAWETVLIDSIVFIPKSDSISILKGTSGESRRQLYDETCMKLYYSVKERNGNVPEKCKKLQFSISAVMNSGALQCLCDRVGTRPNGASDVLTCASAGGQCPCKANVIGRTCNRCAPGSYGFSSTGCKACNCDTVGSNSRLCDSTTGQCSCIANVVGRQCNQCPANHFGFPSCRKCQCNGHSTSCDPVTGVCQNCQHNTAGDQCEKCSAGYYGDATKGTSKDCSKCQCPGGSSGNQFSKTCYLDKRVTPPALVCDACEMGYTGGQCEKCADGYFGKPWVPGGKCQKCNCNGNIDAAATGKCDSITGECFNCLYQTTGFYCHNCQKGYFGNALNRTCRRCVCNENGTDPSAAGVCDPVSGQCSCLKHVVGIQCDQCEAGYWNLASGKGCEPCSCDKEGSLEAQCNQLDGQCRCRTGFGGRACSECEDNFWGNPKTSGCKACLCNPAGSVHGQCDRKTGKCGCRPGVIGDRCDMCDARTTGVMPKCEPCHPCFDQWDETISAMEKNMTNYVSGSNITSPGAIQDLELETLKQMLKDLGDILAKRKFNDKDVNDFRRELDMFRKNLTSIRTRSISVFKSLEKTSERNRMANDELDRLFKYGSELAAKGKQLSVNMEDIAYGDVAYAYNVTLDSEARSNAAQKTIEKGVKLLNDSMKIRGNMENEVVNAIPKFLDLHSSNQDMLKKLAKSLSDLTQELEKNNKILCGQEVSCGACDTKDCKMCGGANCTGVKDLAKMALERARKAEEATRKKEKTATELLTEVLASKKLVESAIAKASMALKGAMNAKKLGQGVAKNITVIIKEIHDFLDANYHHPEESEKLASMVLALNISLTPNEISELAMKINETVRNLTNVNAILEAARNDELNAMDLKRQALNAKASAKNVSEQAGKVIEAIVLTADKQIDAAKMVQMIAADHVNLSNKLNDLRAEIARLKKMLEMASNTTMEMEVTAAKVEIMNEENKLNLISAKDATEKAAADANSAERISDVIKKNFSDLHDDIIKRSNALANVKQRALNLIANSKALYLSALNKITQVEELNIESRNREVRAKDLGEKLAALEKRIANTLKQINVLVVCHAICNPGKAFCGGEVNILDNK